MNTRQPVTRRAALKGLGGAGLAAAAFVPNIGRAAATPMPAPQAVPGPGESRELILKRVLEAPLIDTHEHLIEEKERLQGTAHPRVPCDDWALLLSHYLDSDFVTAGMPEADMDRVLSPRVDPVAKWPLIAPYWPAVKNTGYAQAVRISIRELYGVEELSSATIRRVQAGYEQTRRPGFYRRILQERARIESCQVNCLTGEPFKQSDMPTLLMQDLSIVGMFAGPDIRKYAAPTGIKVGSLEDWHRVIRWWFDRYATYAVAVKSQHAYHRDIDYARVPPEEAEPVFTKVLQKEPVTPAERRLLEDHLFWQAVDQATARNLPVKLHTGYYAGHNSMPLSRLRRNAGSAAELCRMSPDTKFVFMHLCYPYYEELLAVVKQWANAHVDMCWAWIINPVAAKDYLKKHIVTAPINKLLPFGGDYIPVEPVLGHAMIARRGIARALTELVQEGWLNLADALDLVDPILHQNARQLFRLAQKAGSLRRAPWAK
ncbi:MAG: amidohydrolase family protein [Verrucomicrobia bacterium]|nr:amidohydrolase family protein [Verrucomicrobiota bacterium]